MRTEVNARTTGRVPLEKLLLNTVLVLACAALCAGCESPPQPTDGAGMDAQVLNDASVRPDSTGFDEGVDAEQPDTSVGQDVPPVDGGPSGEALPPFDAETQALVRDVLARGMARGNRRNVFSKLGDSITESASFLFDYGFNWYALGDYAALMPTITYFSETVLADGRNSFNHPSLCATAGWTTGDALEGDPDSPVARELDTTRPEWALIMYGTNDVERSNVETFRANLGRIVDIVLARDVVPVLSTIPPRADAEPYISLVPTYNVAIRALARERHLPLMDYWVALQALPNYGLSPDGVHPASYRDPSDEASDACDLTAPALAFGYNMRNLLALQMLARLRGE